MTIIRTIKNKDESIKFKIGNKASNIFILKESGVVVPYTICLFDEISDKDLEESWDEMKFYLPLAVRSSMSDEDNSDKSSAGKYQSFLGINNKALYIQCIKSVILHSCSENIAVIVQQLVKSDFSGIAFSFHSSNFYRKYYIESTYGLGETLVTGLVNPDTYIVNQEGVVEDKKISDKKFFGTFYIDEEVKLGNSYLISSENDIKGEISLVYEKKALVTFDYYYQKKEIILPFLKEIAENMYKIEELFNFNIDVEFAINNKNVIFLQARKAIKKIESNKNQCSINGEKISGICASPGVSKGIVIYEGTVKKKNEKYILVTHQLIPSVLYNDLTNVVGLAVEIGSILSHGAIIAREFNIPCLVGIESIKHKIKEGDVINLNASEGYLEILES